MESHFKGFYMKTSLSIIGLAALLGSGAAMAVSDPVAWSLTPATGFAATLVGNQSVVQYTLTNRLPFTATLVTQKITTGGNFTVQDECNNASIAPGKSCDVSVGFSPTTAGNSTFQLIYGYHNNRIPLPVLTAVGTPIPFSVLGGTITDLPATFYLGNTPDFTATFTNKGNTTLGGCSVPSFSLTGAAATGAIVTTSQNTCAATLAPGNSCTIVGQLGSVNNPGPLTVNGYMQCGSPNLVTAQPTSSAIVQNEMGCAINASTTLPLPQSTHKYSDNVVKFKFENECTSAVTMGPVQVVANGVPAQVTVSTDLSTCSSSLAAGTDCEVLASIIPQGTGTMTVSASVTAGTGQTSNTSTTAQVVAPVYNHTVNFINQCPFAVWYGVENIPANPQVQDPTINPTPDTYKLAGQVPGAAPVVKSMSFLPNQTYLGEFFPRTGCEIIGGNLVCNTGDCNSPAATGKCNGDGKSPFTRIEEVFFGQAQLPSGNFQGTYDLSVINGVSIPVEFKGLGPANSNPVFVDTPFYCTGAGAPIQPPQPQGSQTLGACGWEFTVPIGQNMPTKLFNFVTYTATNYNCATACGTGEVCGLAYTNNNVNQPVTMSCGKLLGYWTINQSCSANTLYDPALPQTDNPKTVFNCNSPVPGYPLGANRYDIYSCNTPAGPNPVQLGSCYPSTSGPLCCGARDWNATPYLTAQDLSASTTNPDWTGVNPLLSPSPYQSILWLKEACPTSYVYPYDDHSSSFRCFTSDSAQQTQVRMDFDVVFCPGGLTGQLSLAP